MKDRSSWDVNRKKELAWRKLWKDFRFKSSIEQREGLYDKILVKAKNYRVIPVTAYMNKLCNFTGKELHQLDGWINKILRDNNIHGKIYSHEGLYLRRELDQIKIKYLKDVYTETKVRVAYHMTFSSSM